MKTVNTFLMIVFLLPVYSNSGQSLRFVYRDNQVVRSFNQFVQRFYPSNKKKKSDAEFFASNWAKVYHHEAISFPMGEGKRWIAYWFPELENGTTKVLFPSRVSNLALTETNFNFIFHLQRWVDLKNEWFNQYQF
jgi:hypothetical protein